MRGKIKSLTKISKLELLSDKRFAKVEFLFDVIQVNSPLDGRPTVFGSYENLVWDYVDRKLLFFTTLSSTGGKIPDKVHIIQSDDSMPIIVYEKLSDLISNPIMYFDGYLNNEKRPGATKLMKYIKDNNINVERMIIDLDI